MSTNTRISEIADQIDFSDGESSSSLIIVAFFVVIVDVLLLAVLAFTLAHLHVALASTPPHSHFAALACVRMGSTRQWRFVHLSASASILVGVASVLVVPAEIVVVNALAADDAIHPGAAFLAVGGFEATNRKAGRACPRLHVESA